MTGLPPGREIKTDTGAAKAKAHPARRVGQIIQGIAIGSCLPFAIFELIRLANEITPFNYQGF